VPQHRDFRIYVRRMVLALIWVALLGVLLFGFFEMVWYWT
jgi:hypothetical protein